MNAFGVLREGIPIKDAQPFTDIQVITGIEYKIQLPGCVPFFEEYDAMVEANHNEETWAELGAVEKAGAVAFYRIKRFISLHEGDAIELKRKLTQGPN